MKTVTDRKLRIALFGGSFDPVHIGHLFVADEVRLRFGYDRVVFVPASQSPHKSERPGASAEDRLAMLERAIDQEAFVVDPFGDLAAACSDVGTEEGRRAASGDGGDVFYWHDSSALNSLEPGSPERKITP